MSDVPAQPDPDPGVDPSEPEVTTALRASPRLIAAAIGVLAAAALLGGVMEGAVVAPGRVG